MDTIKWWYDKWKLLYYLLKKEVEYNKVVHEINIVDVTESEKTKTKPSSILGKPNGSIFFYLYLILNIFNY